jgi:hypothetical protein
VESHDQQQRPAPEYEPPVEPGDEQSLRGLAAVARIVRGRERAADAAGVPPLDSDQVLDLQRTAGNRLTAGALERWLAALPQENVAQQLLEGLFSEPRLHDAIATALDALDPRLEIHVTGPQEPTDLRIAGPHDEERLSLMPPATVDVSFKALFGPAAAIAPDDALTLTLNERTIVLRVPFAADAEGVSANLR